MPEPISVVVHPADLEPGQLAWFKAHGANLGFSVTVSDSVPQGQAKVSDPVKLVKILQKAGVRWPG